MNYDAEQISRKVHYDDYAINDDVTVFAYIDEAWGPHTIDRLIITRKLVHLIQVFSACNKWL